MDYTNFNAEQARNIVRTKKKVDLKPILEKIRIIAESGRSQITISVSLNSLAKQELERRGFAVEDLPSIAIQKDGDYHCIHWD